MASLKEEAKAWIPTCLPTPSGPPENDDRIVHVDVSAMVSHWLLHYVTLLL